jgi:murein DD-endopeptidase MepM/ murein hydrolase activator NlpD
MCRRPFVSSFLVLLAVACWPAEPAAGAGAGLPCLVPPVRAPVSEPFAMPPCRFCPGRRGMEFDTRAGDPVVAAAAGTVTFAGVVVGTRYLVVQHPDRTRATYGGLAAVADGLDPGAVVLAGSRVGTAGGPLYFGLRDDDPEETPIDPTPLLGIWRYRSRLLPTDGSAPRPVPTPRLVCRNGSGRR